MAISLVGQHMEGIPFSSIRRVFEKADKLAAQGVKVINFGIGRPDFDTPEHIKAEAKKALDQGRVHYTPNIGILELRQAIADSIKQYKKVDYDPNTQIMVTSGGQEAIYLSLRVFLNPGDEVLVPDPGYPQFTPATQLAGGCCIPMPLIAEQNYMPDLETIATQVTEKTKAMIVNSPHNPTGAVLDPDQLSQIAEFAKSHGLVIFSDDAYDRIVSTQAEYLSPAALPGMKDQTVIWGSLSKTYAMTGWRIGYIAAPAELIRAAVKMQQNVQLSTCSFSQAGAVAALNGPQECVEKMAAEFSRRRDIILDGISTAPGLSCPATPRGAFYAFVHHKVPGHDSQSLADLLLEKAGVAVIPGTPFGQGGQGYLRISYATSQANCQEGMARINDVMKTLVE